MLLLFGEAPAGNEAAVLAGRLSCSVLLLFGAVPSGIAENEAAVSDYRSMTTFKMHILQTLRTPHPRCGVGLGGVGCGFGGAGWVTDVGQVHTFINDLYFLPVGSGGIAPWAVAECARTTLMGNILDPG